MEGKKREKLLIFIVAYNAENHIEKVLDRIPEEVLTSYEYEILIIDDCSKDDTFGKAKDYKAQNPTINLKVLYNPINQMYGGNQMLGYHYAIDNGFDLVVLLHGDGQYAPEVMGDILQPFHDQKADCVMGSRMINKKDALKGGMPFYKYFGNIVLTSVQNWILKSNLYEFHSGYRAYRVCKLSKIPFESNSKDYNFDTQIIIQLLLSKSNIVEVPIPTYYGDEICHVDGLKYGRQILKNSIDSRLHGLNIFYKKEYDVKSEEPVYDIKLGYKSSHTMAIDAVTENSTVLDIGCGEGLVARELNKKGCKVIGVDMYSQDDNPVFSNYYTFDCNQIDFDEIEEEYDEIVMLDIIEHLASPEDFLRKLRNTSKMKSPRVIITTPNIAFFVMRIMLLLGQFNYGKKGILDITHTRLFTFKSLKTMLSQSDYEILKIKGVPPPIPKAIGRNFLSKLMMKMFSFLILISKSFFSYQIYVEVRPNPTVKHILEYTTKMSKEKK